MGGNSSSQRRPSQQIVPVPRPMPPAPARNVTKIQLAAVAAIKFIAELHGGGDRGMIAHFSRGCQVIQPFTQDEPSLHRALLRLTEMADGGTRLYDSIDDIINEFWRTGDRSRPWILIILTDGQDNESVRYRNNPRGIGQQIMARYNHIDSNFIFLVAVGNDRDVNMSALQQIGETGRVITVPVREIQLLEQVRG